MGETYDRLSELPAATDDGQPAPGVISLSDAAKSAWKEFVDSHGKETASLDDDLAAAWAKLEGAAARLAMMHHLVRVAAYDQVAGEEVDLVSVRAGIELVRWFGVEARRIYGMMDASGADRQLVELVELIRRNGGGMTARDLQRASGRYKTSTQAQAALQRVVDSEVASWVPVQAPAGGRPSMVCRLLDTTDN
jgi:hypothetical protein